jgi:hypothetical protein
MDNVTITSESAAATAIARVRRLTEFAADAAHLAD